MRFSPARRALRMVGLVVFFWWFAFGLGYASISRYDATLAPGLTDTRAYVQLASSGPSHVRPPMRYRILVPSAAGATARFLERFNLGHWNKYATAFLIVSATLVCLNALLVCQIGEYLGLAPAGGLLAGSLFMMSFCTVNAQLVGLVDSVEALAVNAMLCALLGGAEWLVVVAVVIGVLGKETVLPLAVALLTPYVLMSSNRKRGSALLLISIGCGALTLWALHSWIDGPEYAPHHWSQRRLFTMWRHALRGGSGKALVYHFAVLLPAGVAGLWSLGREPLTKWFGRSTLAMVVTVILLALYAGIGAENMMRPLASATSAALCVGAAKLIQMLASREAVLTRDSA